jgi:hypothetical protein
MGRVSLANEVIRATAWFGNNPPFYVSVLRWDLRCAHRSIPGSVARLQLLKNAVTVVSGANGRF